MKKILEALEAGDLVERRLRDTQDKYEKIEKLNVMTFQDYEYRVTHKPEKCDIEEGTISCTLKSSGEFEFKANAKPDQLLAFATGVLKAVRKSFASEPLLEAMLETAINTDRA